MARRSNRSRSRSTSRTRSGPSGPVPSRGDLATAPPARSSVVDDPARSPEDPAAALLADLDGLRRRLHDLERSRVALLSERDDLVRAARALGITWPVLTTALGVSRQALLRPRP